jgi:signal transduction histidine kinase
MNATQAKDPVNILLVDDQPGKLLSYETILADLGENLVRANSGNEALAALLQNQFAVVLVDVCMPELDGFELAAMIRQHPRLSKTAIILVSGVFIEDTHRLRGYDSGAVDYVSVPIIPEILRAKVSVFADRFRKTEELERLNRELEERVAIRTREIEASAAELRRSEERLRVALERAEQARAEAEQANRLKDQFLAVLSHELRSPLSAILGWAEILKTGRVDAAARERAVDTIRRNARLQSRIISDVLDVSSILAGKLSLRLEAIDLKGVVSAALDSVRPAAEAKGIRMSVDSPDNLPAISADAARLQQVVWNVLSNAIDFAPQGGHVELRMERSATSVTIRITDDGPGIRPDFLPFIFDRFRQEDSSSTRPHRGLGLGLAIVEHLVSLHGGCVTAANRTDRSGAVLTITLPTTSPAARPLDTASREPRPPGRDARWLETAPSLAGIRVLIVDDARDSREIAAELLRRCGADTAVAGSVEEALGVLAVDRPDLVLADIEMPVEDGYDLLKRIRALPPDAGGSTPVAAVTAYASEQDRAKALASGFATHISKPFDPVDLVTLAARYARKSGG